MSDAILTLRDFYINKYFSAVFTFTNENGAIIDITNYQIDFVARKKGSLINSIDKTMTITDGTTGKAVVELSETETNIEPNIYYFQLVGTDDQDHHHVFVEGNFKAKKSFK